MTITTAIEAIDAAIAALPSHDPAIEALDPLRNDLGELGNRVGGGVEFSNLTAMLEFKGGVVFLKL